MREGFVIYKSFYDPIEHLTKEQKGMLLEAIFEYQINGTELGKESPVYAYFMFFKNQFRIDEKKYESVVNRNKANGLKGGRPKETQDNPNNPVGFQEPKKADKEKDKEKKKEKVKRNDAFAPPSLSDVKAYFDEKGYTETSAERAYNYYTERNWVDAKGNKVSNWKSKMISVWFKDENKKPVKRMVW